MANNEVSTNRESWDKRAAEHFDSAFYDVDGFLAGKSSLNEPELALLPDLKGKRLLHLQCHFGLDTLSFARAGASATGIDFSAQAVEQARTLQQKTGLDATFICSDVLDQPFLSEHPDLQQKFDLVFTSYGAIEWLNDIQRWANIVAEHLKPGGQFTLVEFHPFYYSSQGEPYFYKEQPDFIEEVSYTENATETLPLYVWTHPVSTVINALITAGLQINTMQEYPWSPYNCFEGLIEIQPGRFATPEQQVPLMYAITATKPG